MVCNASRHHNESVRRIEELLQANADKDKVIDGLRGFRSEAARIGGGFTADVDHNNILERAKRPRVEAEPPPQGGFRGEDPTTCFAGDGSGAWDQFHNMMRHDARSVYY